MIFGKNADPGLRAPFFWLCCWVYHSSLSELITSFGKSKRKLLSPGLW